MENLLGGRLEVPAGALAGPVRLTVTCYADAGSFIQAYAPFPSVPGVSFGPDGQTFLSPVMITMPSARLLTPGERMDLFMYDGSSERWVEQDVAAVVGPEGNTVQAQVDHFCCYAPLSIPPETLSHVGGYLALFEPNVALEYYVGWFIFNTNAVGHTYTLGDTIYKQVGLGIDVMYLIDGESGQVAYSNMVTTSNAVSLSKAHDVMSTGGGAISYDICVTLYYEGSDSSQDERFPYVSILNPQPIETVNGPTTIGTYTQRAQRVYFYADSSYLGMDDEAPFSWEWDATGATEGRHLIWAYAYDADGDMRQDSVEVIKSGGPIVLDVRPLPAAEQVELNTTVTVTFSRPMEPAANEGAFTITPATAGSFEWPAVNRMTFVPAGDLQEDCMYTVTVGAGVEDHQGNPIFMEYDPGMEEYVPWTGYFYTLGELQPPKSVEVGTDRELTSFAFAGDVTITPNTDWERVTEYRLYWGK
ncbi:MAG: Ig-like domain-containing protein [Spirochaetales bacterium]|nr:Ig-like domain-containing protein [Spirochaetales bacterium]